MKIILFGATGMVGAGVLLECLDDARVESILVIGRTASGVTHAKLREIVRADLFSYDDLAEELTGIDACFFCLGTSAVGMSESAYHRVTYDLTIAAASALAELNPGMTFCYVSGVGTDSSEKGRFMWARVKGRTENELLRMRLDAYMFRPGFIQPLRGVRSKTNLYQAIYSVTAMVIPLLRRLFPNQVTTTTHVGRAMINVAASGFPKRILGNREINILGEPI